MCVHNYVCECIDHVTNMLHTKICELKCWDHVHAKLIYRYWSYVYPILWLCFHHVNKLCANGYQLKCPEWGVTMATSTFQCQRIILFLIFHVQDWNILILKDFIIFLHKSSLFIEKNMFFQNFKHFWDNVISVETWNLHMQKYTWIHMLRSCMSKFYICMCWSIHTQLCECILYHVYKSCVNGCTSWSVQSEVLLGNCNISMLNSYFIFEILC
jgi:hypothetical protein